MRVLPCAKIPISLWKEGVLHLPEVLSVSYVERLKALGLIDRSIQQVKGPVHGGKTRSETHDHFALRFAVSAGRTEYSILGPCNEFQELSDAFLTTFSNGSVMVLDIPCGTGAMTAALISTLIHLRREKILPTLPLRIHVCAGDYSEEALSLFEDAMGALAGPALLQAIKLEWQTQKWDATRGDDTAALMDRWFFASKEAKEFVVVVSNFSGALHTAGDFERFSPCLEQILSRLHDRQSTVVWVEPSASGAATGVLRRLSTFISSRIMWFMGDSQAGGSHKESVYKMRHPVSGSVFDSNVAVHRFIRK